MGSPDGEGSDDEHPQHRVYLDGFWVDQTEVTNYQYHSFVSAIGREPPTNCGWGSSTYEDAAKGGHPVVCVSWEDAAAYCEWAGARLPTEAEWEKAARGTDGRVYPWGNEEPDCSRANYWGKDGGCVGGTSPVGSYLGAASPYGALDMAGNAWEWVNDWFGSYGSASARNPQGPESGELCMLRGGSWNNESYGVRSASRSIGYPDYRNYIIGFRCGMSSTSSP